MNKIVLFIYITIITALLQSCSEFIIEDHQKGDIRLEDFEKTWSITDEWYPYFEFKKIDWDSVYYIYYPKVIQSYSDEYLLLINQMLLELKDGHVALTLKNGRIYDYSTPRQIKDRNCFDFSITKEFLTGNLTSLENDRIQYGLIENLGYVRISTFSDNGWIESMDDVFHEFRNTQGLIIDVRHNVGGHTGNAGYIVAKCIQTALPTPGWVEKGEYYEGITIYPDFRDNYSNPIVVLVDGISFSSAEHFALWMQHIEHITLIGDTTGGGSGNPLSFTLPSGNEIRVSTRCFYRYDGQPIEWNGIIPDTVIEQTEADILNGEDKQIEYAIEYLN